MTCDQTDKIVGVYASLGALRRARPTFRPYFWGYECLRVGRIYLVDDAPDKVPYAYTATWLDVVG